MIGLTVSIALLAVSAGIQLYAKRKIGEELGEAMLKMAQEQKKKNEQKENEEN